MKKLGLSQFVVLGALLLSHLSYADSYNIRISDESFGLGASFDQVGENSSADIDWMHDDDFDLFRAGIYVDGVTPEAGPDEIGALTLKIGVKAFILNSDFDDGSGLALGGGVDLPFADKLSFYADAFYASGKLSFDEVDNYQEWSLGVRAHVIKNGYISVGYSVIEVDTDNFRNVELEDGVLFQVALQF